MNYKRVMIAAPKSGSGKTMVTCALLWALKDRGEKTVCFKCGPDYIDPMFHEQVIGVPSKNLDTFFTGDKETRRLFLDSAAKDGIAVMEGVMGVFDGLGGVREEGSSYHLAQVTGTGIILVVDARGMGRSVAALLSGFLGYDKEHLIRGVILNRISGAYFKTIRPFIERELGIEVLGYFPEQKKLQIGSRHLGLVMPGEIEGIRDKVKAAAKELAETVSIEKILKIAGGIGELDIGERRTGQPQTRSVNFGAVREGPVIAVARDESFCFYYEDNLRLLQEFGARIQYFSPLHDESLPNRCCGLLLGGGYPELYAGRLSKNRAMLKAVREAVEHGMPMVAECGGFMYLHSVLVDKEGARHDMAGVLSAACFYTESLVRFGYVEVRERQSCFLPQGQSIKGHEFHYYDSTDNGSDAVAIKPVSKRTYPCIIEKENCWMGFPHLYYPSNDSFARRFVEKAGAFSPG